MNINDLDEVQKLKEDLAYWQEALAALATHPIVVNAGDFIIVSDVENRRAYAPEYCDDVLVPLLKALLDRKLDNIVTRLRDLGVVIPE